MKSDFSFELTYLLIMNGVRECVNLDIKKFICSSQFRFINDTKISLLTCGLSQFFNVMLSVFTMSVIMLHSALSIQKMLLTDSVQKKMFYGICLITWYDFEVFFPRNLHIYLWRREGENVWTLIVKINMQ